MRQFRVLMMLTALLATATAVHAQSPPAYLPPQANPQPESVCPVKAATTWYMQTLQDGHVTFQRIRAMCTTGSTTCKQPAGCCETAVGKVPCCVVGLAGCVKGCETVQAPKACCCAKACACCESCKVKKEATVQILTQPMPWRAAPPLPPPFPMVCAPAGVPVQPAGVVQIVPVPPVRVVQIMQVAHQAKPAHFVTPDLDVHCERITHCGDHVVLEGNVLLLCKKHAQPIRIEAQCVKVNMKDGTYTVESNARPVVSTSFGVIRTTGVCDVETCVPPRFAPAQRTVPVRPTSTERINPVPPASAVTPDMLYEMLRSLNISGSPY